MVAVGAVRGVQGVVENAPCGSGAVGAERIARVFHSTVRIHRLHEPDGTVARVADAIVGVGARRGVVVVGSVVMSSYSGG